MPEIIAVIAAKACLRREGQVIDEVIARRRLRLERQRAFEAVEVQPRHIGNALTAGRVHNQYLFALRIAVPPPPGNLHHHGLCLLLDMHHRAMVAQPSLPRLLCYAISGFVQGQGRPCANHEEQDGSGDKAKGRAGCSN